MRPRDLFQHRRRVDGCVSIDGTSNISISTPPGQGTMGQAQPRIDGFGAPARAWKTWPSSCNNVSTSRKRNLPFASPMLPRTAQQFGAPSTRAGRSGTTIWWPNLPSLDFRSSATWPTMTSSLATSYNSQSSCQSFASSSGPRTVNPNKSSPKALIVAGTTSDAGKWGLSASSSIPLDSRTWRPKYAVSHGSRASASGTSLLFNARSEA